MVHEVWFILLAMVSHSISLPNIVLLTVDGLGWGDLAPYNIFVTTTPNINKLARKGITYLDFHSGGNIGSPSSAALLTGRYGQRNGVHSMFYDVNTGGLPLNEVTLPQIIKKHGYRSGFVGTWDLGHTAKYFPTYRGFDYFYGVPYLPSPGQCKTNCSLQRFGVPLFENDVIVKQPAGSDGMSFSMLLKKSIDFMNRAKSEDSPYLLILSISHLAYPSLFLDCDSTSCKYANIIASLDELTGALYSAASKESYPLFMFMSKFGPVSENCDLSGDSRPYEGLWQLIRSNGGSRTAGTNWEGGHRVPLIVVWEKSAASSQICKSLTSSIDVVSTVAAILNLDLPRDRVYDGEAMLPCQPNNNNSRVIFFLSDVTKEVFTFRHGNRKVFYATRGHATCTNRNIPTDYVFHNPPLVFDLNTDQVELFPIPLTEEETEMYRAIKLAGNRDLLAGLTSPVVTTQSTSSIICCNKTTNCTCSRDLASFPSVISSVERPPGNDANISYTDVLGPTDSTSPIHKEDHMLALYGFLFICLIVVLISISAVYSVYNRCFRKVISTPEHEPLLVDSLT